MLRRAAVIWVLALAWTGVAAASTRTDEVVTMADGAGIATTLHLPDGSGPFPAIVMAHGLGGSRTEVNALAERLFVPRGYVVLTYDARGHGESGGLVDVDGPLEIADLTVLYERLRARPDVIDDRVGAWGISYGGGAILRAAAEGVPFAAIAPHETWSDLYSALLPQDLPKTGVVLGFLAGIARPSPLVAAIRDSVVSGTDRAALRDASAARSSRHLLGRVSVPTFWAQGKRDYAFDIEQAAAAFRLLRGPKRLYLGNLGHAPSTFLADDADYFLERGAAWFDRFLKGVPNGIDTGPPVELAPTPFRPAGIRRFAALPRTRDVRYASATFRRTIGPRGKIVVTVPAPARLETFGSPVVTVTASTAGRWPHLVAVLSALRPGGTEVVLATGGVPTASLRRRPRRLTIRLSSWSAPVPRGARLRLTLATTSTAQDTSTPVYVLTAAATSLTVRGVSWRIPVLSRAGG